MAAAAGDWSPDPRFRHDANVSMLYPAVPWWRRPAAAAADGHDAVESWWPFGGPLPADGEVDRFVAGLREAGTRLVLLNTFGGDLAAGDRGIACDPGAREVFAGNLAVVAGLVEATGCPVVHALHGNRLDGVGPAEQEATAAANLALAARTLAPLGATVVVEPMNTLDCPRYPLPDAGTAVAVLDRALEQVGDGFRTADGRPPLTLLLDVYHLSRMARDVPADIRRFGPRIGHVQLADVPGRGRPGTGAVDFAAVMDALAEVGYDGYVGLEHLPG